MKRKKSIILSIICGFITTLSIFSLNEIIVQSFPEVLNEKDKLLAFFTKFEYNFKNSYGVIPFVVFIAMSYLYYSIPKNKLSKRMAWLARTIGMLVSLSVVIGQSLLIARGISLLNYDAFQVFIGIVKIL